MIVNIIMMMIIIISNFDSGDHVQINKLLLPCILVTNYSV